MSTAADGATAVDALLARPAGLSTLDLIGRQPRSACLESLPEDVRREMAALAAAELRRQQLPPPARAELDLNRLGLRADEQERRALLARLRPAPAAPEPRKLVGGQMLRASEPLKPLLGMSKSAPALRRPRPTISSPVEAEAKTDAESRQGETGRSNREQGREEVKQEAADGRAELRQREELLHAELLRVTHKLCRKHARRLAPADGVRVAEPAGRGRTQALADEWAAIHRQQQAGGDSTALDRRRHAAFAAGRFSTQSTVDYCARALEPREPERDHHRRHKAHTKYGDALARSRSSLRGAF